MVSAILFYVLIQYIGTKNNIALFYQLQDFFILKSINQQTTNYSGLVTEWLEIFVLKPLPDILILGFSKSAANKDMQSKIWTNGDTVIRYSRKHFGKSRNHSLRAICPFLTLFSKPVCC